MAFSVKLQLTMLLVKEWSEALLLEKEAEALRLRRKCCEPEVVQVSIGVLRKAFGRPLDSSPIL